MSDDALVLVPYLDALRAIAGRSTRLLMAQPCHRPVVGVGALRVLRIRSSDEATLELTVGYDGYARLGS